MYFPSSDDELSNSGGKMVPHLKLFCRKTLSVKRFTYTLFRALNNAFRYSMGMKQARETVGIIKTLKTQPFQLGMIPQTNVLRQDGVPHFFFFCFCLILRFVCKSAFSLFFLRFRSRGRERYEKEKTKRGGGGESTGNV